MTVRTLNDKGQELYDEFLGQFEDRGCCSCHINPPCSYCTHPGNPDNLAEDESVWEDD